MRSLSKLMTFTLALGCASAFAADQPAADSMRTPPGQMTPDGKNTEMNTRDKNGNTPTPEKQSNRATDLEVLAAVRQAVVADESLSMSAHNVKILVEEGIATLRGTVESKDEKTKIETLTQHVTGVTSVNNELDIETK